MTLTRRDILDLIDRHGLRPSRALGQNFVADPNTVRRIARLARVQPGDRVVEIGAGLGSLTLALVEAGAEVLAIERDRHIVPVLRSLVEPAGVRVLEADAMTLDWEAALDGGAHGPRPWRLVANLPYNVAVPLILDVLEQVPAIESMFVMVQREVGERLGARPGDEAYGAVSVKVAYWATAWVAGRVPATVFVPRPKVESALVGVTRRPTPAVDVDRGLLFELVEAGFAHRRKMLRRSLASLVDEQAFEAAGIRPEARAEELDLQDWARLARCTKNSAPSPS